MNLLKKHSTSFTLLIIGIIVLFSSLNVKWGDDRWNSLIRDDAKGYYAYLPAVFIYNDLSFKFYDTVENDKYQYKNLSYDYRYVYEGNIVNKYYTGTAIAQMPFFLTAHFLSEPLGYSSDGYSKIYWISIGYAAIFYLLLGWYFLSRFLQLMRFKNFTINLVLLSITFGTHLFYYTAFEPGMSHIYSFAFVSWFMLLVKKYFINPQNGQIILIAALIGLIVLIRPINGLIVFLIPFLAGSLTSLKSGFYYKIKHQKLKVIFGALIGIGIVSIQLLIYKWQTGSFIVYSYDNEGFRFLNPHMIDILFSYKKGLFLYTPLTFMALFGGYYLYKKSKFQLISLSVFFVLITYFLSSWWSWWYGGSFSSRVYIEYLPIFCVLLAYLFQHFLQTKWKYWFIAFLFLVIVHNQKQTYLYRIAYIHWDSMTKEKYWEAIPYPVHWWYYEIRNELLDRL